MRTLITLALGATALTASAAVAPAAASTLGGDPGVSFQISVGNGYIAYDRYDDRYDRRYHDRYRYGGSWVYAPKRDYWGAYPVYGHGNGYGYQRYPGYDHLRRNHYRYDRACYWRVDQERYRGRPALVKELVCYGRGGYAYEVPGSERLIRYLGHGGYDRW